MSGLSPEARRILDAARDGDDPTSADKERLRGAVLASVGSAAALGAGGAASSAAAASAGAATSATTVTVTAGVASSGLLVKAIGLAVAVGIAGGTVALEPWNAGTTTASEFEQAPILETDSHEEPISAPPTPASAPAPEPEPETTPAPAAEPVPAPPPRRMRAIHVPPAPARAPATLADELTLLRAAHAARRAGDPARALAELDRHARTFPDGILSAEAQAARVLTLCDLGRTEDVRAQRDAFLAAHPGSPLASRVQNACH